MSVPPERNAGYATAPANKQPNLFVEATLYVWSIFVKLIHLEGGGVALRRGTYRRPYLSLMADCLFIVNYYLVIKSFILVFIDNLQNQQTSVGKPTIPI